LVFSVTFGQKSDLFYEIPIQTKIIQAGDDKNGYSLPDGRQTSDPKKQFIDR